MWATHAAERCRDLRRAASGTNPVLRRGIQPGRAGLGDPLYPLAGNGGYDVAHYVADARLRRRRRTSSTGNAVITARATQNLSRFDLDLRGFAITQLARERPAATFTRGRTSQELIVTPGSGPRPGLDVHRDVRYAGTPAVVTDPDGSIEGWVPTDDGAFVVGEPQGSPAWYPVNDNPRDKATYDFASPCRRA